ncbi:uncharacterized protein PV06_05875 [Exophiala oligosperma]|uniref:Uncharacterized protein n=1 Tax=Exophiala oligosperma TaxID=215243 RepID=A0A0D2DH17_9EURO|nr:uncharacterized protein PV06_05875 [Exophiala oligosperma]KIW42313.1 hypothetical protein PV06_05875 [Exophiala oligosperma]
MASVFEGLMTSRRRPSRSRSDAGKPLHARWGDSAISAPHDGGWAQQYADNDFNNPVYQAHGSPDSQKTLVNTSPDLSIDGLKMDSIAIEEIRQPTPPFVQKERNAITITIPLPWSRKKEHRRSASNNVVHFQAPQPERTITAEARPALTSVSTNVDEVIVAEARPASEGPGAQSPVIHTTSPVYDDVSTFFTRAAFPEKGYAMSRLPPIQTSVPPNKSQPASAISVLSPVAEKYNGLSESNNATPMDNTPIAKHIDAAIPAPANNEEVINVAGHTFTLASSSRSATPASLPPSRVNSPIEVSGTDIPRTSSRGTTRDPPRSASRGPSLADVAYMRTASRGSPEQTVREGRGTSERRSASQEPVSRRVALGETSHRRALSREPGLRTSSPTRRRALSREPEPRRSLSREPDVRLVDTSDLLSRRARSREPTMRRAVSPNPSAMRAQSRGPISQEVGTPVASNRRALNSDSVVEGSKTLDRSPTQAHIRGPSSRRGLSPVRTARRAASREPFSRRRISGEFSRRAASQEPVRRRASPREDFTFPWAAREKAAAAKSSPGSNNDPSPTDSTYTTTDVDDGTSADETTDIETETDEVYFESRKGWNGRAGAAPAGQGFYAGVLQDYKAIGRDVEAEQAQSEPNGVKESIVNLVTTTVKKSENKYHQVSTPPEQQRPNNKYGGPDLVPSQEELWG